jgi:alkaline phosphatase D
VIEDQQIDNIVVLSADSHLAAAMEVARDPFGTSYDPATGAGALMSELMAPSVTAPAGARFRAAKGPEVVAATHPHFKYLDNQVHGYLLVEIERGRVDASWHASETLLEPNTTHAVVKRFRIETGDPRLVP